MMTTTAVTSMTHQPVDYFRFNSFHFVKTQVVNYLFYTVKLFLDSAHALFVRATYLVCHRLISSWKTDLNTSLAALELLSGLARIHISEQGNYKPVSLSVL